MQQDELTQLIKQLTAGAATHSTIRRIFRISQNRQDAAHKNAGCWSRLIHPLFVALEGVIQSISSEEELQESCLLLLRELMENQTAHFQSLEKDVVLLLLDCRSDGTSEVSGSAEDALMKLVEKLDRDACFDAFTNLLSGWNLCDPEDPSRRIRSRNSFAAVPMFQPCPAVSALYFLGKLIKARYTSRELDVSGRMQVVVKVVHKAINSDRVEIRKAAVDCLVDVGHVVNDRLWEYVGSALTDQQLKLLGVFVARSNRR
eukprot:jgi/Hompol1/2845/HPOL_003036-RA